jgi:hypothetical protein
VELLDPEQDPLSGSTEGPKGFPEGHLLADPGNLFDDLLLDPVQKVRIGRIGNVLGLRRRIHRHPPGFHQAHLRPGVKQDGLDPFHPLRTDPVAELDHRGGIQKLTTLEGVESAETLPVGVLMQHLHRPVVRAVVSVLQNVDAHHQSNGFAVTAHGTVVN